MSTDVATQPVQRAVKFLGLSGREWRFIEAYVGEAGGNGVEAARIAGIGSTYHSWSVAARRLLDKDRIRKAIAEQLSHVGLSAQMTVARIGQLATATYADFFALDAKGNIIYDDKGRPAFDLDRAKRAGKLHLIEAIKFYDWGFEIKLPRKAEYLALAAKVHGLLVDKVETTVTTDGDMIRRELFAKLQSERDKILAQQANHHLAAGQDSPTGQALPSPLPLGGIPTHDGDVVDVDVVEHDA